jgi:hypothetical protein
MGDAKNCAMGDAMGFHQHKQPHSQKKNGRQFLASRSIKTNNPLFVANHTQTEWLTFHI